MEMAKPIRNRGTNRPSSALSTGALHLRRRAAQRSVRKSGEPRDIARDGRRNSLIENRRRVRRPKACSGLTEKWHEIIYFGDSQAFLAHQHPVLFKSVTCMRSWLASIIWRYTSSLWLDRSIDRPSISRSPIKTNFARWVTSRCRRWRQSGRTVSIAVRARRTRSQTAWPCAARVGRSARAKIPGARRSRKSAEKPCETAAHFPRSLIKLRAATRERPRRCHCEC
jgi:hypothetical protein